MDDDIVKARIQKILDESVGSDWRQDFNDQSADEVEIEVFNKEYAADELMKFFLEYKNAQQSGQPTPPSGMAWRFGFLVNENVAKKIDAITRRLG